VLLACAGGAGCGSAGLPLNKLITIVGGFANSGNASLNITSVMGSVNSPFNFDHYLLNVSAAPSPALLRHASCAPRAPSPLTRPPAHPPARATIGQTSKLDVNIEVAPGTEQSFEYSFKLHPSVTTAKFRMAITVFYEDEEEAFATTFFNSTVAFYDVAEEGEAEGGGAGGSTFTWLLVLGIGGYVFITKFDGKQKLQDAGVLDALGIKLAGASDDFDTPTAAKKGKSKTKKQ